MIKRLGAAISAGILLLSICTSCSHQGSGSNFTLETTEYTIGTGQNVKDVRSDEDTLMEREGEERTLRIGAYGENFVTSTLSTIGYNNIIAISCIYDCLFSKDYKTGEVVPQIAADYEFIPNEYGQLLHITINENARFQSGDPITAGDCYNSIITRMDLVGAISSYLSGTVDQEHSYFEGDHDLYIQLYQYDRTILDFLCAPVLSIGNQSFEETATDDDMWDQVDGSGPFIVEEQISGDSVLLKVDDNYWGWGILDERPNYDYMSVKFYSDAATMMIDYENGIIEACLGVSISDTKRMVKEGLPHTNTRIASSGNYTVICLPAYNEAFRDPRVREAIFLAIDTDATAQVAYGVLGNPMNSYVSSMASYRKEYQTNKYDPERAKKLLEEAGYGDGELSFYTVVSANDVSSVTLAETVQDFLSDVGVNLEIDTFDFPTALKLQRNGTVDLCITTFYTSNCDISGCLVQLPEGSYNQAAWLTQLDQELEDNLNNGLYAATEEEAEKAYSWVQDWLDENLWYIPVVEYNNAFVCRDYVDDSGFYNLMHARDIRNLDLLAE